MPECFSFEPLLQITSCPRLPVAQKNVCDYKEDVGNREGRNTSDGVNGLSKGLEK